jgi:hypothetical protein
MVLSSDDYREEVRTSSGRSLHLTVVAIEPVADIAVLGSVDNQRSPREADAFEQFCEATVPVPLYRGAPEAFKEELALLVYNLDRKWTPATGHLFRPNQCNMVICAEKEILRGASGGPIITPAGELVALVSICATDAFAPSSRKGNFHASGPRPLHALPQWVVARMEKEMTI